MKVIGINGSAGKDGNTAIIIGKIFDELNPELVYEYIISRHFLLTAKTGTNIYFMNGIYKSNRKGVDGDPLIKMDSKKSVFFNIGISYNI